jgi:hypothetical protein
MLDGSGAGPMEAKVSQRLETAINTRQAKVRPVGGPVRRARQGRFRLSSGV